jgi:hypothetical protein
LTVADAKGQTLGEIQAHSSGAVRWTPYWTIVGVWAGIAARSMSEAFDALIKTIPASPHLKRHLAELAQGRELPPGITTTAQFNDEGALLANGRLDAGEEGVLLVQVFNQGPGPAYDIAVRVTSDRPQIVLSGDAKIGHLEISESKQVALRIAGNLDLATAVAKIRIEVSEKRGYGARPVLFELPTSQLVPPHLEIVDVSLDDRPSGRTRGDGDGQPANSETLEAVVRVRNTGPGEASGVEVKMSGPKATAEILEGKAVIPRIPSNQAEEVRLLFRLPIGLQENELPLSFQAIEARGAQVASTSKEQTWKIRAKRPVIELAYRLYDGNSTESSGNRDGLVNNGERIEVAITATNRGDLPARGVRIAIDSADPKMSPVPAVLEIGDLPARAEGAVQRFAFEVPRAFVQKRAAGDLLFTLNISQKDFPPRREPVALSFRSLRPELLLEIQVPSILTRGEAGEVILRLRNNGMLRAEEVLLEVSSGASGVDLIDERGAPASSRRISLGRLEPGVAALERRLRINVRRNAAIGNSALRIAILQKDFQALLKEAVLGVKDEPEEVIAAQHSDVPERGGPATYLAMAPATISFLRNTQGEHLLTEAIVLRFEVQSPTELAEARLTQNERLLPLDAARHSTNSMDGLQVAQYEVPVQLENGENRFEVVAITRQGLRSSRSLTLFRDREVGRIWVVAIGVGRFEDPSIPELRYAEADAQGIYNYFRDTFGLPEDQIYLRLNEQATLREVKSVLGTQLVARANDPRDTVILYLAGHGMRDRMAGSLDPDGLSKYFLPFDANRADLYSTALEMDEVTNILRRLTPERVVVLLDTCFSGAAGGRSPFDPRSEGERALISSEFLDRMAHVGKGRVVLTASGPEEAAQESSDFAHGVFTYYLLDGLRGAADLSGEGEIDVHEIYRYVSEKVSRTTKGRQNPKLKEPDLVGRILLGRGAVRSRR